MRAITAWPLRHIRRLYRPGRGSGKMRMCECSNLRLWSVLGLILILGQAHPHMHSTHGGHPSDGSTILKSTSW